MALHGPTANNKFPQEERRRRDDVQQHHHRCLCNSAATMTTVALMDGGGTELQNGAKDDDVSRSKQGRWKSENIITLP